MIKSDMMNEFVRQPAIIVFPSLVADRPAAAILLTAPSSLSELLRAAKLPVMMPR